MTEQHNEPKKVNLADAMKEMLAKKKQQQANQKAAFPAHRRPKC